jgi:hypothetical protein
MNGCESQGVHSGAVEDSGLLGCDAALPGVWFPTFQRNIIFKVLR